ncbi:MAG: hypothetical protein IJC18_01440 [Clostridia bacterium]|nr:hypothetical protein [Clostridia bacterium]MBQ9994167.1 hypothetical protein [Clostridia bacterium]
MKDTIRRIIDIDKKAREATKEALERKSRSAQAVEEKKAEVSESVLRNAHSRVEQIRVMDMNEAQEQWEEIRKRYDAIAQRLDESFEKNKDAWVESIVARVIGGEN